MQFTALQKQNKKMALFVKVGPFLGTLRNQIITHLCVEHLSSDL